MNTEAQCGFDVREITRLLLDMARERSLDSLLRLTVERLSEEASVALARIWLIRPGDICETCRLRAECKDRTACLHLVASAGASRNTGEVWDRLNGDFRRFPLGVRKVGMIGASGESVEVEDIARDGRWIARPDWAEQEGIRGFGGQPLLFQGKTLGVLAVFTRICMTKENIVWLRMIADHTATAIANARAFEEIADLQHRLEMENEYLREEVKVAARFGDIVGESSALRKVLDQIELVAPTDSTVLINGESGTGKELVARAIHERSRRADRAMVKVNCASIPRELFESEFFGHVKGAFTGAVRDRAGRFQLADHGTLFLDEVGEIPLELQSKLLRVLQEGTFERVGEERTRQVDVRLITASNRDLKQEVEAGRFREDLYYRLSVFPVEVAPLRERPDDIPLLAAHLLAQVCRRFGTPEPKLRRRHIETLQQYNWPGNIRELRNVIERAVITSPPGTLVFTLPQSKGGPVSPVSSAGDDTPQQILTYDELQDIERRNAQTALQATHGKISGPGGAAELLDVKPTTLTSRLKAMGLNPRRNPL